MAFQIQDNERLHSRQKYRLLELNKSSAHYGSKIEGRKCLNVSAFGFGGCPDFIDENGCNFIHTLLTATLKWNL